MNELEEFDKSLSRSTIERLDFEEFSSRGLEVYVKRDDLIHPFISGNKWRKLKHHLLEFLSSECNSIQTYGGAYSNHLLATACAGALLGVKTRGVVRGDELKPNSNPTLQLCHQFGMELEFITRSEYKTVKLTTGSDSGGKYHVAEGAYGQAGAKGCSELIDELDQSFDHIVLDVGTGTTYAGVLNGIIESDQDCDVHGIVVLKNAQYLNDEVAKLVSDASKIQLHHDYHYGGFGKWDEEQDQFNRFFSSSTGILVDPVYTGKLFRAFFEMVRQDRFTEGEKILIIHTGGMTGLLS